MLGASLRTIREFGPLLFLESLEDFHFGIGLRQGLAAQLQLLGDELPSFVNAANAGHELDAMEAAAGGAVDSDVPLATEPADLIELPLALGQQFLALTDEAGVVGQNLGQQPLTMVAAVFAIFKQRGERKGETVHGLAPAVGGRTAVRGGAGFGAVFAPGA